MTSGSQGKGQISAAAKVRIARQFIEQGDTATARKWLDEVVRDFGDTPAAEEAAELLEKLPAGR